MVGRGMVRHEIEHQLDVALCQPLAELRKRRVTAQCLADRVGGDREAGAADIVLGQIGQNGLELGCAIADCCAKRPGRRRRSARRSAARSSRSHVGEAVERGIVDVGQSDRLPASRDRRSSQTRVLI